MVYFILFFVFTCFAVYLIGMGLTELGPKTRFRLPEDITGYKRGSNLSFKPRLSSKLPKLLTIAISPFSKLAYLKKLQDQADVLRIPLNVMTLVTIKFVLAVALGIVAANAFSPLYGLLGAVMGFFFPDALMMRKIRAKKTAIMRTLPETVDLLDMCISAGQDFLSAIKWLIDKSDSNPFIEQLGVVLSEVQVGKTRAESLKDMGRRLNIPDVGSFVRTIVQAERMGTSIEEAFRNLSEDTRDRRFQTGERYAIKASLYILFPLLFCILPAIMIIVAGPILVSFSQGDLIPSGTGVFK